MRDCWERLIVALMAKREYAEPRRGLTDMGVPPPVGYPYSVQERPIQDSDG